MVFRSAPSGHWLPLVVKLNPKHVDPSYCNLTSSGRPEWVVLASSESKGVITYDTASP